MKKYECIVPGCTWETHGEDEAEIVRRAAEHMRTAHEGMEVRESTIEQIKAKIQETK